MLIIAKSKLNECAYDKLNKHADAIELHLEDEIIKNANWWDGELINDLPIKVVHAPLLDSDDVRLEIVSHRKVLLSTCKFAQQIASVKGYDIIVVIHLGMHPEEMEQVGIYESVKSFMQILLDTYPNLHFAIENVIRLNKTIDGKTLRFRAVDFTAAPTFAKDMNNPRVGTCLDTCHAMMDMNIMHLIAENIGEDAKRFTIREENLGIEGFFEANKDTIKLIHLARINKHGCGADHGLGFSEDNREQMSHIISLYRKYQYTCPITIEVKEDDYYNAVNFQMTRELLLDVLKSN